MSASAVHEIVGHDLPVRYVQANGLRFAYVEEGEGPLVLFLHGFPDNAWTYRRQLSFFGAAGYHAVAPFLRGYAPSEIPQDGAYDPLTLAHDVEALAAALSPSRQASVVGMDWGATALFALLAAAPSAVKAAVAMSAPHPLTFLAIGKDPAVIHWMFHVYFFQTDGVAESIASQGGIPFIDYLWRMWSPSLKNDDHIRSVKQTLTVPGSLKAALAYYPALLKAVGSERYPVNLITTPTLTIYGEADVATKHAALEEPIFKGPYRRIMLPGVGHFPHLEREPEVNGMVLEWLRRYARG
jgi:pimeloyl-ACP methyl ester carboxylesterase